MQVRLTIGSVLASTLTDSVRRALGRAAPGIAPRCPRYNTYR